MPSNRIEEYKPRFYFDDDTDSEVEDFYYQVPSATMSLTSLAASNRSPSFSSIGSQDEHRHPSEPAVLTIEELRHHLNSCFTCGVNWRHDHVSLDCSECGGYSLSRPCAECDGKCRSVWKRDLTMSHASGKARWLGMCAFTNKKNETNCISVSTKPNESSNHSSNY